MQATGANQNSQKLISVASVNTNIELSESTVIISRRVKIDMEWISIEMSFNIALPIIQ